MTEAGETGQRESEDIFSFYVLGTLLLIAGIALTLYFIFGFKTTVETDPVPELSLMSSNVNNIGLVGDRIVGVICGATTMIIGTVINMGCYARSRR